jgi:hypothetical protein
MASLRIRSLETVRIITACGWIPVFTCGSMPTQDASRSLARTYSPISLLKIAATVLSLLCLSACLFVVPHPMTTKDKSITGEYIKPDVAFARVGVTNRAEIEQKLASFSAGYKNDKLFWARWAQSTHGITGGIAIPYGGGAGGTDRFWSIQNIFYFFDQTGKLTSIERFDDGELFRRLSAAHKTLGESAPDFTVPTQIEVLRFKADVAHPATVRLSGDQIDITEASGEHSVSLKREQIVSINNHGGDPETSCLPNCTEQTLKFAHETDAGKQVSLKFDLPDFEKLVWWMEQKKH